jgi:hypothetical protein
VTLSWSDRWDEALGNYEHAIAIKDDHRGALLGRARLLSWMAKHDESLQAYQSYLAANPNDPDALLGVADLHLSTNRVKKARRMYENLLDIRPEEARSGLERADQTYKIKSNAAVVASPSRQGSALPGVSAGIKWIHRPQLDFWGSYALEQSVQPGELGITQASAARLHRAELGTSFSLGTRMRMAISPGVAVDANRDSVHAVGVNLSAKLHKLVLLGSVRPQIDSGGDAGVLASLGAQWLFAPEAFLMGQVFRFDGAGSHVTSLVSTVRSRAHAKLTVGGIVGVSFDGNQKRYPLGAEIEAHSSNNLGWFARYDWFGSGPQHRLYVGIRWSR